MEIVENVKYWEFTEGWLWVDKTINTSTARTQVEWIVDGVENKYSP